MNTRLRQPSLRTFVLIKGKTQWFWNLYLHRAERGYATSAGKVDVARVESFHTRDNFTKEEAEALETGEYLYSGDCE